MIALIPFRKGSQRIPDKNIRIFNNNGDICPLFMHTAKLAGQCRELFKTIIVYSDYSYKYLQRVMMMPIISNDAISFQSREKVDSTQPASEYIKQVIARNGLDHLEDICLLQPTCPLRSVKDIYEAVDKYHQGKEEHKTLVSVSSIGSNKKLYLNGITGFGSLSLDNILAADEKDSKCETVYMRNSSIYIFNVGYFNEHNTIFDKNPNYYIMPAHRSIDIDTEEDFKMAEALSKVCDIE